MKSHSENYGLCGRTRARRPQMSPEPAPVNKKSKSADLGDGNEEKFEVCSEKVAVESISNADEEESKSDVVDPRRTVVEQMSEVKSEAMDESVKCTRISSDLKPEVNDNEDDKIADKDGNVISPVDTSSNGVDEKKLEIKMSKKIVLKKFPTKLKELLRDHLLGMFVAQRYIFKSLNCNKVKHVEKGLPGVIKGCGILCFCETCGGKEVVTPNQFELHAGSANKRPPEYIYLDNGGGSKSIDGEGEVGVNLRLVISVAATAIAYGVTGLSVEGEDNPPMPHFGCFDDGSFDKFWSLPVI
ncbi:hypothetical protein E3N88_36600 [Mikania micrantha]|uniref:Tify domain-containing protein n=1 Tax=Mikania micrantha TaxID=192012 RepID=A0A5N6M448_9ASTR|nr:hypothetical protein E3N88_36600 [Mikania micrantha]